MPPQAETMSHVTRNSTLGGFLPHKKRNKIIIIKFQFLPNFEEKFQFLPNFEEKLQFLPNFEGKF